MKSYWEYYRISSFIYPIQGLAFGPKISYSSLDFDLHSASWEDLTLISCSTTWVNRTLTFFTTPDQTWLCLSASASANLGSSTEADTSSNVDLLRQRTPSLLLKLKLPAARTLLTFCKRSKKLFTSFDKSRIHIGLLSECTESTSLQFYAVFL